MTDGDEPHPLQTVAFHTVVDDVAQTIQRLRIISQHFFSFANGACHTKAKPTARVNLNLQFLILNGVLIGTNKPLLLFGDGEVAVVEDNGIVSLT